jgi:tol-pal system protein YbgF
VRFARSAFLLAAAAAAGMAAPAAQAQASRAELEQRVAQLERQADNQGLLELARQLEMLSAELRSLRGDLEELQFALQGAKEQQRAQYLDLDRRLQAVEERASQLAVAAAGDPDAAYQAAFERLKAGQYAEARAGFEKFLADFPGHELASNAQYWLGEVAYVGRDYEVALAAFGRVLDGYPDARKAPDALLKMGYCQYELHRDAAARTTLGRVVADYPGSGAARDAAARLARMAAEGR